MAESDTISKDELSELKEAFSLFDLDGNGTICKKELSQVMFQLNGIAPGNEELDEMFNLVDSNKDGNIDFKEFVKVWSQQSSEDEYFVFFKTFDKDSSGTIDRKELKDILKLMGEEEMSENNINGLLSRAGIDLDSGITFEQFKEFMTLREEFEK